MAKKEKPKTLTPKLRFPEFKDGPGWNTCALEHIAERMTTRNSNGVHSRVLTNSAERGILDQRDYFEREIVSAGSIDTYYVVERGDYVYNPRTSAIAPVGPISRNNLGTGVMSPLYSVFRFTDDDTDFYEHYFKSAAWHSYLRSISSTGARHDRMSITSSAFMQMPVPTPDPAERRKIVACLTSLDEWIAAEGQKLEALRAHKKGLMQQLFPREGDTRPRLRFPEFRDEVEWSALTLGDLVEIASGNSPSQYKLSANGAYPFVKVEDLNNCVKYQTAAREYSDDTDGLVPPHSLIFPKRGAAIELNKIRLSARDLLMDTNMMALTPSEECESEYLFYYLSHIGLSQIADSSTIPQINNKHIVPFEVVVPSAAEQRRIAASLSPLDALITAQSRKLEGLRTHKKGLVQQLFPSVENPEE